MVTIFDDLSFCQDCMHAACGVDATITDEHRAVAVETGLTRLGPGLVPAFDSETGDGIDEFSRRTCSCCGSSLGGGRWRFSVLGPEPKTDNARSVCEAMDLMQLGEELIQPLRVRTVDGKPLTPRDWAAIALAALDQAGADRSATTAMRHWIRQFLGFR